MRPLWGRVRKATKAFKMAGPELNIHPGFTALAICKHTFANVWNCCPRQGRMSRKTLTGIHLWLSSIQRPAQRSLTDLCLWMKCGDGNQRQQGLCYSQNDTHCSTGSLLWAKLPMCFGLVPASGRPRPLS